MPTLVSISAALIVLHFISAALRASFESTGLLVDIETFGALLDRFDLDGEATVPSWFDASLLLINAIVLGLIARDTRIAGDRWWKHWAALSAVFVLASMDEAAAFHELLNPALGAVFPPDGVLSIGWWAPAIIVVIVAGVVFTPFLRSLDTEVRTRMLWALGIFVGGALGVEIVESFLPQDGGSALVALYALEEGMEFLGLIVLLTALREAQYANQRLTSARSTVEATAPRP